MDLFLSVHLQKKYLLITLLLNLLILFKWTLLEKSLGSLLRSLVTKSLIDNIFVERLGFREIEEEGDMGRPEWNNVLNVNDSSYSVIPFDSALVFPPLRTFVGMDNSLMMISYYRVSNLAQRKTPGKCVTAITQRWSGRCRALMLDCCNTLIQNFKS